MLAASFFTSAGIAAQAQTGTFITGTVSYHGAPVALASVELLGNNLRLRASTDTAGAFSFPALSAGHYVLNASKAALVGTASIDAGSAGANVNIVLAQVREIGAAFVSARASDRGSGTSIAFNGTQMRDSAASNNFPDLLAQLPASARGSNGQIHLNGDHGNVDYIIDGVPMPQTLVRILGDEFDPANVTYAEFIEGAYPAQYGDHFGLVANIGTRSASGSGSGMEAELRGGSFATAESSFTYHTPVSNGGSLLFSSRYGRSGRGLDPPVADATHNANSLSTEFLRVSLPAGPSDNLNFDLNYSHATFQIPPDTAGGAPAWADDNEFQSDVFATLQYRHAIGTHGSLSFGPLYRRSNIRDTNDLQNDFAAGAGNDCATVAADCVFSAATDRTARSYGWLTDYALRSQNHEVRAGLAFRTDSIDKHYQITLQPANFVQPAPFEISDNAPNVAHAQSVYVQDSRRMGQSWTLDTGVRSDSFQLASTDFRTAFSQLSPRVKLTRIFSPRASLYGYYGRLFVPFSFENISAGNARFLNPASGTAFDLKPERDSLYEIGGHLPVGSYDLGLRLMHKRATNPIDDGQAGATNLQQDINFAEGVVDIQSALLHRGLPDGGTFFASVTHGRAFNRGCGSSLLIDCSAFPADFAQADHDQRWSATAGAVRPIRGGWYSANAEYGSGLSSGACDTCKVPPHFTMDAAYGRTLAPSASAELIVKNVFNDRYALTLNSALQGTHYAAPRSVELVLRTGGP